MNLDTIQNSADVKMLKIDFKSSTHIFPGIGETFPNLRRLRIDNQSIEIVERENFEGLEQLEVLDFSRNQIKYFINNIFWDLQNLTILAFSDNQIELLQKETFQNLKQITEINFSNNKIEHFPKDLFKNNLMLKRMFAYKNPLKTVDIDFTKLKKLRILWMEKSECIDAWAWSREVIKETQDVINENCKRAVTFEPGF